MVDGMHNGQMRQQSEQRNCLLPALVDSIAESEPESTWCEFPSSPSTYDDGYRKITYKQLANAVNGAASWLEKTLGRGKNFETLAYIGSNDPRYPIFVLGAVKAGYKVRQSGCSKTRVQS